MKTLSELLKSYVEKSGYTVYSLSYVSKVNRTTLQRAMSGERSISRENLDRLMPYLHLTPNEKNELENLFYRNQIGEYNYQKFLYLKDMLETIELEHTPVDLTGSPAISYSFQPVEEACILNGIFAITQYIYQTAAFSVRTDEMPYIYALSPFHGNFFLDLYSQFQTRLFQKLKIRHLIPFVKTTQTDSEVSVINLQMLSSLIPVAFSNLADCEFLYYYEEATLSNLAGIPFTYYILNNCSVLLLSSDFQKALILPGFHLPFYRQHFHSVANKASRLLDTMSGNRSLASIYSANFLASDFSYTIKFQPYIISFLNNAMIDKYINRKLPEEEQHKLIDLLNTHCKNIRNLSDMRLMHVFCREGLDDFVNHGRIREIPDDLYYPLEIEDRISLLQQLIRCNGHGNQRFYMLRGHFRPKLIFSTSNNSLFILYFCPRNNKEVQVLMLREESIIASCNEFMENLCNSELVYSIDETNDIIRHSIRKLENGLSVG